MIWQVQEAKQKLSEVLRLSKTEDQIITRHGEEIAVIVDIDQYRRLRQARATSIRKYPSLFPPLTDQDFAETMDEILSERANQESPSSRTIPDFGA